MKKRVLSLFLAILMVVGMMPTTALAAGAVNAPFTATADGTAMTEIAEDTLTWTNWDGSTLEVTRYMVTVPKGTTAVTLTFEEEKQWSYYDSLGNYVGAGDTSWTSSTEHTVAVQDSNGDGELDGISVQVPGAYSTEYFIQFAYGAASEHTHSHEAVVTAPTCTEGGYTTYTCSCGDTYTADETAATGHSYESGVCTVCGAEDPDYEEDTTGSPFTVTIGGEQITDITVDETGYKGSKPLYTVTVPTSATEAVLTFDEAKQYCYYDTKGNYVGNGPTSWTASETHTVSIQDSNSDGELDGISVQIPDAYTTEYLILFVYASGDEGGDSGEEKPFLSILVDGTALDNAAMTSKGPFELGSLENESYSNVYENVPYYHVVVPYGTETVDVVYSAETDILTSGSTAYGYTTDLEVDAVSSATIRSKTFSGGYTLNEDGTQTVTTPVVDYMFNDLDEGKAITVESSGNAGFAPVCLFTFEYKDHTHSYTETVTDPTCTKQGYTTHACECGSKYITDQTDALGHSYGEWTETQAPTCTETGRKTRTCATCGETETQSTSSLGHSYGAWEETKAATCTEPGEESRTCATCGEAETQEIAALGHTMEAGVCTVCGYAENAPEQDANGVYQLGTAEELLWFAETVNGGETAISAVLTANIDLSDAAWPSIGTSSANFAGSFDGQGYTVTLKGAANGLFAYVRGTSSAYAEVKNVTVDGTISSGSGYVGGIIAVSAYTNVSNCVNRADITSSGITAGIVGYAIPQIGTGHLNVTNCGNEGNITTTDGAAGIVGSVQTAGVITGCYNIGNISGACASGYSGVAGIVGYLQGYNGASSVTNCYNAGTVSGSGKVGGLVGDQMNSTSIANCYNTGTAPYAIAGRVYNKTGSISNTYYLDTSAAEAVPESSLYDSVVVTSKTHEEMRADDFAATLGDAWQSSCPYPVLTWQTAVAHDYQKGVCSVCSATDPNYVPEAEEPEQVDGVYQIGTAEELFWFAAHVNEGNTTAKAVLTADIDLQNASWTSIGTADAKFAGSFDGQNHKVSNLYGANGLFGTVEGTSDANAVIKNVTVDGTITAAADCVGGIVGSAKYATIENCVNMAAVSSAYNYVGGIVGLADSCAITACGNEGTVGGVRDTGGIVGQDKFGPVTNCWNHADVSSTGSNVGGIVGELVQNNAVVTGCYNKGTISGKNYAGGIAGYAKKPLVDCYNWGTVTCTGSYAGGVAAYLGYIGGGVKNCYNAGFVTGGGAFGNSPLRKESENCYYLEGTASTSADTATVKTADEMKSADFVTTLGSAYKQGSVYPILTWQPDEAAVATYAVTLPEDTGYTVMGPKLAIAGEDYTFSVTITEGYLAGENFAVQVNGETVTGTNGVYTVENVSGALTITVIGVELEPAAIFTVTHPATGNGYAVETAEGYDASSVTAKTDYKFTVTFANGFKAGEDFAVKANDVALTADENGVYTIENVTDNQVITVAGVEMIPYEDTVSVNVTVTYGEKQFYNIMDSGEFMMLEDVEVPYFDLALYGLEKYYYNPDCYTGRQSAGNKETAYGVVTLIHTFIYITEVYYLDMDPADAGKGISYTEGTLQEVLSWTGGVGSSFMNLWDHGTNLNYYINYEYPLGAPGWGSTSDQEALEDGDIVSMHLIQDQQVSSSNFSFFTVNDADKSYTQDDTTDTVTVKQGEEVELTLYWTGNGGNYTTVYDAIPGWNIYWIDEDNVTYDIRDWNTTEFAGIAEGELITDENGTIVLDTSELEPGTYYIGSLGGKTAGGTDNGDGFISRGGETGAGVFKLVVEAGEKPEALLGDINLDGEVNSADTNLLFRYVQNYAELNEQQLANADVNKDGEVNSADTNLLFRYVQGYVSTLSSTIKK